MATLIVMYKTPKDTAAFDKHYFEKHIPLAKKIPGLRKYEVNQGPVATPAGPSGYHLVALLHYDNMAAIQKAFASPEGQAAVADIPSFATGGADIIMCDTGGSIEKELRGFRVFASVIRFQRPSAGYDREGRALAP